MSRCITYAAHQADGSAYMAIRLLGVVLQRQLIAYGCAGTVDDHVRIEPVRGREPACATVDSVALLTCGSINYPSRYFRLITPKNREKLIGDIPHWARSTERQVLFNPNSDINHVDKQTGKNCFEMALQDLHRSLGGWHAPARKRPKYVSGHKARMRRDELVL